MGVKYRMLYKDSYDQPCRFDILHVSYSGEPIPIRGSGGTACIISHDCSDDPYEPIVNSKAAVRILQEKHWPVDILELMQSSDREFTGAFYVNNVLKFKGFLIPDGIQQIFQAPPFVISITFTDGLKLLDGITYNDTELRLGLAGGRCIINYFRSILFSGENLGLALPLRWVSSLTNDAFPLEPDALSGSVRWAFEGEGFTDYNGNVKSCKYILEGMLRSLQCRLHQTGGRWVIERINDITTGAAPYRETPGVLSGFTITTGVDNMLRSIGGDKSYTYQVVNEDALVRVLKGLKYVKTTYSQNQRENILPNGNMDIVTTNNKPLYWGLANSPNNLLESFDSLSSNRGKSARIRTFTTPDTFLMFRDPGGLSLPIDTDVLYTYINFGFKFLVVSGGVVNSDGYIQWSSDSPFNIQIEYHAGDGFVYFLNEFGFWVTTTTTITPEVASFKRGDIAEINFNSKQNIIMPLPRDIPIERTQAPYIAVFFNLKAGIEVAFDDIYINTDTNSDVYKATSPSTEYTGVAEYTLDISSAHSGFYVSNYMTDFEKSGIEKFFSDSKYTGTLTAMNSHAIMRNRYKSSLVFESSIKGKDFVYNNIYELYTLAGKKFLPLNASWNTETNIITIEAVEVRNDGEDIEIEHYGSNNDVNLSN